MTTTQQVNNYNRASQTNTRSGTKGLSQANGNDLSMQDFLNLLAAQLANQDMMNPSSDTEFIGQMAQFTSLQTMQTMTEITYAQYGASMIGKNVIVAKYDNSGNLTKDTGVVEKVLFAGGDCTIVVNGESYSMSSVMEVLNELPKDDPADEGEKPE